MKKDNSCYLCGDPDCDKSCKEVKVPWWIYFVFVLAVALLALTVKYLA